eukprot:6033630-Pyramimonas_sp.AAC.1
MSLSSTCCHAATASPLCNECKQPAEPLAARIVGKKKRLAVPQAPYAVHSAPQDCRRVAASGLQGPDGRGKGNVLET